MKKSKIIETPLPEAMIQHIQSFMSGKEAARTTILSKSWSNAWLTRPTIDLDYLYFGRDSWWKFDEFTAKTMQRYRDSRLKIESFRLHTDGCYRKDIVHSLIVSAMKLGATDLEIGMLSFTLSFTLPQEVLGYETLARLSLIGCRVDGNYVISCSRLKFLSLQSLYIGDDVFKDIISCCTSMEELSLSSCRVLVLSSTNMYELHKLRRLCLDCVDVDGMFFSDFASRFPCLKDLSIHLCGRSIEIHISSRSLEIVSFKPEKGSWRAMFDVPNIRKFSFSGSCQPSNLSIKGVSKEWEFDISIECIRFYNTSWFLTLKRLLTKFRLSRINLSICLPRGSSSFEEGVYAKVEAKPLGLENLMIDASSSFCSTLLVRLFGSFRPKFITLYWLPEKCNKWWFSNETIDILCMRLMQQLITPNCGIPNQNMFGKFGLKKVNVEVYEMFDTEWRPLLLKEPLDASKPPANKRKVRFELIWD